MNFNISNSTAYNLYQYKKKSYYFLRLKIYENSGLQYNVNVYVHAKSICNDRQPIVSSAFYESCYS